MAGSSAALPCSLKSSVPHDSVRLVLWFKEMEEKPIYTVDARGETPALCRARPLRCTPADMILLLIKAHLHPNVKKSFKSKNKFSPDGPHQFFWSTQV